jgi:hypothetical protein
VLRAASRDARRWPRGPSQLEFLDEKLPVTTLRCTFQADLDRASLEINLEGRDCCLDLGELELRTEKTCTFVGEFDQFGPSII